MQQSFLDEVRKTLATYFTSESVSEGHPDKLCDQIADAILDAHLQRDPQAHVACEVTASMNQVNIMGEITSLATVDYEQIARDVIRAVGYTEEGHGFQCDTCKIFLNIHKQSPDIAIGVTKKNSLSNGAGDQGMMFGFACDETPSFMPLPIELAHAMTKRLADVRKSGTLPDLLPDGKGQITVEYRDGRPYRVDTVVLSAQHKDSWTPKSLQDALTEQVIYTAIPHDLLDNDTKIYVNPTGRFTIGGPAGDTGLTGRKIIVDTYGGYARHGGGAFSGKDASKVDRSAAYMARYLAKNLVAAQYMRQCEIQLSYAIGIAQPVAIHIETFGTGKYSEEELIKRLVAMVDLSPSGIIEKFGLQRPIYARTACYGHFGENARDMPWEALDLAERLQT